jgi:hypothetical protein
LQFTCALQFPFTGRSLLEIAECPGVGFVPAHLAFFPNLAWHDQPIFAKAAK